MPLSPKETAGFVMESKPFPTVVYYFPINGMHEETGDVFPVRLKPDGSADLSQLPDEIRKAIESCGVPSELRTHKLYPKDGGAFLHALLLNANGYRRFRSSPESTATPRIQRIAQVISIRRPRRRR